jgi:hypothetical protein
LRQTPYLKVYLLRCDDSDSYKSTYRKAIREWLKANTPLSQSSSSKKNSQENHDAFEWLILHVVLPNTGAASEPKHPGLPRTESGTSEKSEKSSKFLSRNSGSILEKLRADFNVSSKSAPDRVAQIILTSDQVHRTSAPADTAITQSQEQNEAWDDIFSKIKALILASFDLRVTQYEDDIREKEAQRSLPGWNFCTFFVLKEGLALGFESVGLVEDALIGYETLSAELDTILGKEDINDLNLDLPPFTEEIKGIYQKALDRDSPKTEVWGRTNLPVSSARKNFRELILENRISVFDFKCYVFARKVAVLLRMSRASQSENLLPLGELCQFASGMIPNISRILRDDLIQM